MSHSAASQVLHVAAVLIRIAAIVAVVTIVVACFGLTSRLWVFAYPYALLTRLTPGFLVGTLSFVTPFGGLFRGDFALVAVVLFVLDWVCLRLSTSPRLAPREGEYRNDDQFSAR